MDKKFFYLLSVLLAAASAATAQQLYKTVGADGKVTFSDRPQIDDKSKLSVMQSYTLRAVEPPKPKVDAAKIKPRSVQDDAVAVITREVEDVMVTIMGLSAFGGRFEIFCSDSENDSHTFSAAAQAWKQRNVAAVEHQKRLLMSVISPTKRAELISREEALLAEEIGKLSGKTPAARKEWCQGVIAELNSGRSDIAHPALMAVPFVPYKAK